MHESEIRVLMMFGATVACALFTYVVSDRESSKFDFLLLNSIVVLSLGSPLHLMISTGPGSFHIGTIAAILPFFFLLFPVLFLYLPSLIALRAIDASDRFKIYVSVPFVVIELIFYVWASRSTSL